LFLKMRPVSFGWRFGSEVRERILEQNFLLSDKAEKGRTRDCRKANMLIPRAAGRKKNIVEHNRRCKRLGGGETGSRKERPNLLSEMQEWEKKLCLGKSHKYRRGDEISDSRTSSMPTVFGGDMRTGGELMGDLEQLPYHTVTHKLEDTEEDSS